MEGDAAGGGEAIRSRSSSRSSAVRQAMMDGMAQIRAHSAHVAARVTDPLLRHLRTRSNELTPAVSTLPDLSHASRTHEEHDDHTTTGVRDKHLRPDTVAVDERNTSTERAWCVPVSAHSCEAALPHSPVRTSPMTSPTTAMTHTPVVSSSCSLLPHMSPACASHTATWRREEARSHDTSVASSTSRDAHTNDTEEVHETMYNEQAILRFAVLYPACDDVLLDPSHSVQSGAPHARSDAGVATCAAARAVYVVHAHGAMVALDDAAMNALSAVTYEARRSQTRGSAEVMDVARYGLPKNHAAHARTERLGNRAVGVGAEEDRIWQEKWGYFAHEWSPTGGLSSYPIMGPAAGAVAALVEHVYTFDEATPYAVAEWQTFATVPGTRHAHAHAAQTMRRRGVRDAAALYVSPPLTLDITPPSTVPLPAPALLICGYHPAFALYTLESTRTVFSATQAVRAVTSLVTDVAKSVFQTALRRTPFGSRKRTDDPTHVPPHDASRRSDRVTHARSTSVSNQGTHSNNNNDSSSSSWTDVPSDATASVIQVGPPPLQIRPQRPRLAFVEGDTVFNAVCLDARQRWVALVSAGAGRVYVADAHTGVIHYVLKGCRAAQVQWVDTRLCPCSPTPMYHGDTDSRRRLTHSNDTHDAEYTDELNATHTVQLLCVLLPLRHTLEVHCPTRRRRIAAYSLPPSTTLLPTLHRRPHDLLDNTGGAHGPLPLLHLMYQDSDTPARTVAAVYLQWPCHAWVRSAARGAALLRRAHRHPRVDRIAPEWLAACHTPYDVWQLAQSLLPVPRGGRAGDAAAVARRLYRRQLRLLAETVRRRFGAVAEATGRMRRDDDGSHTDHTHMTVQRCTRESVAAKELSADACVRWLHRRMVLLDAYERLHRQRGGGAVGAMCDERRTTWYGGPPVPLRDDHTLHAPAHDSTSASAHVREAVRRLTGTEWTRLAAEERSREWTALWTAAVSVTTARLGLSTDESAVLREGWLPVFVSANTHATETADDTEKTRRRATRTTAASLRTFLEWFCHDDNELMFVREKLESESGEAACGVVRVGAGWDALAHLIFDRRPLTVFVAQRRTLAPLGLTSLDMTVLLLSGLMSQCAAARSAVWMRDTSAAALLTVWQCTTPDELAHAVRRLRVTVPVEQTATHNKTPRNETDSHAAHETKSALLCRGSHMNCVSVPCTVEAVRALRAHAPRVPSDSTGAAATVMLDCLTGVVACCVWVCMLSVTQQRADGALHDSDVAATALSQPVRSLLSVWSALHSSMNSLGSSHVFHKATPADRPCGREESCALHSTPTSQVPAATVMSRLPYEHVTDAEGGDDGGAVATPQHTHTRTPSAFSSSSSSFETVVPRHTDATDGTGQDEASPTSRIFLRRTV